MIVVSNTSPLANLAVIGRVELFQQLYGNVLIPSAVSAELDTGGITTIQNIEWIEVRSVSNRSLLQVLRLELDAGESEAIALCLETQSDLLLMDERLGRRVAQRLGIRVVGLIGALVEAKRRGFVDNVQPVLNELVSKAGFWITDRLYTRVLEECGETNKD